MKTKPKRRTPIFRIVVTAGVVCAALVVAIPFAFYLALPSFFVQDVLYDNVPSKASCSEIPSTETVEAVIDDFPKIADAEPLFIDRCNGAIIEIQVSSHDTREKVEEYLNETGEYDDSTGWWWKSVPIEIHNV